MVHLTKATVDEIPNEWIPPQILPDAEPIEPQDPPKDLVKHTSPLPTEQVAPLPTEEVTLGQGEEITDDELLIAYI
jgi:hypothetical protein